MSESIPSELVLVVGSTTAFEIHLEDQNGQPEDLSAVAAASFTIRESVNSTATILARATSTTTLTIDVPGHRLVGTLTQGEADALLPGSFIGEAALRFGATDWRHTDRIAVRILKQVATHT